MQTHTTRRDTARAMSRENVELVLRLVPPPATDIAPLIRDENLFKAATDAATDLIHPQLVSVARWENAKAYAGVTGFREMWRDWLEPWAEYHVEIEKAIDAGDRVVLLIRDRGRRRDVDAEVELVSASVWELREGKIAKVTFYIDRAEALEAVGLRE